MRIFGDGTEATVQKADAEGRAAFTAGKTLDDNPHAKLSMAWRSWLCGFANAEADSLVK